MTVPDTTFEARAESALERAVQAPQLTVTAFEIPDPQLEPVQYSSERGVARGSKGAGVGAPDERVRRVAKKVKGVCKDVSR